MGRIIPARFTVATDFNYPVTPQPSGSYTLGTNLAITGASQANPCQLTIVANGLSNGNLVYIANVGGMVELNGGTFQVANATVNTITLEDADGIAIDSSAFTAYTSGGTAALISPQLPTPQPWGQGVQWWEVQGVGPSSRTVILTNVKNAVLVYTAFIPYPTLWDPLFEEAFVAALAERIALPLSKDKKFGLQMRQQNMLIAKQALMQARVRDGDEGWFTNDIPVDWMNIRNSGSGWTTWGNSQTAWGGGPGYCFGGYDGYGFSDGSAY
jgi:hypothetical protein